MSAVKANDAKIAVFAEEAGIGYMKKMYFEDLCFYLFA